MAEQYSIKTIREEFKNKGIFYTPPELSRYMRALLPQDVSEVYDPTCGSGNLLAEFDDSTKKYGQDINAEQIEAAKSRLVNCELAAGDTLNNPAFLDKKFKYIVANPPFSVKWTPKEDARFHDAPCLPPPSKADYAFIVHILYYLQAGGVAAVMEFPGILYRGQREGKIRQWIIENNWVEKVIRIPGGQFDDTKIETCIIVFHKGKTNTDILFRDEQTGQEVQVPVERIKENGCILSTGQYIEPKQQGKEKIDPVQEEERAREDTLARLIKELGFSKMVCEIEGWGYSSLIDYIERIIGKLNDFKEGLTE